MAGNVSAMESGSDADLQETLREGEKSLEGEPKRSGEESIYSLSAASGGLVKYRPQFNACQSSWNVSRDRTTTTTLNFFSLQKGIKSKTEIWWVP
ncbi:uncharacterized protein H6S33_010998 [Morchella sextelata]|uniref:uncharacterized protein n=1 Tax=Morchella sextelata TaxID=1174677 RepID=UPI001D0538E4|nr:uncharacterized protein H6S33_010998 [Morchella sextelata]KAH0611733.1 hypothetical protein H6S33_010998 [Morchella sextelata]